MDMKYICFARLGIVMWNDTPPGSDLWHRDVAASVHRRNADEGNEADTVLSAGFCSLGSDARMKCWGRSESLNIDSLPEDSLLIERQLGM